MEMGSLVPARGSRQVIGILRVDWGLVLISLIVDVIVRGLDVRLLQLPRRLVCFICNAVGTGARRVGIVWGVIQNVTIWQSVRFSHLSNL